MREKESQTLHITEFHNSYQGASFRQADLSAAFVWLSGGLYQAGWLPGGLLLSDLQGASLKQSVCQEVYLCLMWERLFQSVCLPGGLPLSDCQGACLRKSVCQGECMYLALSAYLSGGLWQAISAYPSGGLSQAISAYVPIYQEACIRQSLPFY